MISQSMSSLLAHLWFSGMQREKAGAKEKTFRAPDVGGKEEAERGCHAKAQWNLKDKVKSRIP